MTKALTKEEWLKLPPITHPLKKNFKYRGGKATWSSGATNYFSAEYRW